MNTCYGNFLFVRLYIVKLSLPFIFTELVHVLFKKPAKAHIGWSMKQVLVICGKCTTFSNTVKLVVQDPGMKKK